MVAQRKAQATSRRRQVVVAAPSQRQTANGDDGDPARELARLQAMRADALAWVADIERRMRGVGAGNTYLEASFDPLHTTVCLSPVGRLWQTQGLR